MQDAGLIVGYAEALAGTLGFDRRLARRVRREVEDHLREASAAAAGRGERDAAKRAIADFGDPRAIAAEFAVGAVARRARKISLAALLAAAGIFAAMRGRLEFYRLTQWAPSDGLIAVGGMVTAVDRFAFWCSVGLAAVSFAFLRWPGAAPAAGRASLVRLRAFLLLARAAAGALVLSVAADGVLTLLRVIGARPPSAALSLPIASAAGEIVGAGLLVFAVLRLGRRLESTARLLR